MSKTKVNLAELLGTKSQELEEPIIFTEEQVADIISSRELNDKAGRKDRQLHLDEMFPERVLGKLYQSEQEMSEEDLFDLWAT